MHWRSTCSGGSSSSSDHHLVLFLDQRYTPFLISGRIVRDPATYTMTRTSMLITKGKAVLHLAVRDLGWRQNRYIRFSASNPAAQAIRGRNNDTRRFTNQRKRNSSLGNMSNSFTTV